MELFIAAFVMMVVGYTISGSMTKPKRTPTATLDDFEAPQVEDGTPHAVVFGDGWLEGWQVLWYGNYRTTKIKAKGKK